MEDEYNVEIVLEIIQSKIAKLLNGTQTSYENFKKELESLKEKEQKVYSMDKETIDELYKEYANEIKNGGKNNEQ